MAELAAGVLHVVDDLLAARGEPGGAFAYAGDSVGGAVGLQLLLDAPGRVASAVLLCTGARIGDARSWARADRPGRAPPARRSLVAGSAERWFGAGLPGPRARPRLGPAARAPRRRRRGLRAGLRGARRASTSATGSARSTPGARGGRRSRTPPPPRAAARDRRRRRSDGRSSSCHGVAHLAPAEAPEVGWPRLIGEHPAPREARPRGRRPHPRRGVRRRPRRPPRGARRRARRPGASPAPPTSPATSRS